MPPEVDDSVYIEELEAEIKQLRAELDEAVRYVQHYEGTWPSVSARLQRWRNALEEIARYERGSRYIGERAIELKQVARQALEGQPNARLDD
jgi:cell division protein FtsB